MQGKVVCFPDAGLVETGLLDEVWVKFLSQFMRRNGQLPYIERQPWYRDGEAVVDINVNFYLNRPYNSQLDFHKDTAGENLFVNIIFNNKKPTPATEWTVDRATPVPTKVEAMNNLMPKGVVDEVNAARERLRKKTDNTRGRSMIRGGIAPEAAYVSWVDELVWHATPSIGHRVDVTSDSYALLRDRIYYADPGRKLQVHRALRYLASLKGTLIGELRSARKALPFDTAFIDGYIQELEHANGQKGKYFARHIEDIRGHEAELKTAPISLAVGQELAPYAPIGTKEFNQPTRIEGRKRSNSVDDLTFRGKLKQAYEDNLQRSFIRTWVQIRPIAKAPQQVQTESGKMVLPW
jgi:hypothetical protein